jgi:hypothetical protein
VRSRVKERKMQISSFLSFFSLRLGFSGWWWKIFFFFCFAFSLCINTIFITIFSCIQPYTIMAWSLFESVNPKLKRGAATLLRSIYRRKPEVVCIFRNHKFICKSLAKLICSSGELSVTKTLFFSYQCFRFQVE